MSDRVRKLIDGYRLEDEEESGTPEIQKHAHVGRVRISLDLLADMLFPPGTAIRHAEYSNSWMLGCDALELTVEHPDLPAVETGVVIPLLNPEYRSDRVSEGSIRLDTVEFLRWGIPVDYQTHLIDKLEVGEEPVYHDAGAP